MKHMYIFIVGIVLSAHITQVLSAQQRNSWFRDLSSTLYSIRERNLTIQPVERFLKAKQKQLNNYRKNFICIVPLSDQDEVSKALKNNNKLDAGVLARGDMPLFNTLQKTYNLIERYKNYLAALKRAYKANIPESLESSYSKTVTMINKIKPEIERNLVVINAFLRNRGCK